jgi:hypothetical protein
MKRIGAYKNWGALVTMFVLSFQLLTGTGLFCANRFPHSARSLENDRTGLAATFGDSEDHSAPALEKAAGQGRTLPCTCKKGKNCPAIPRAALISNPTHRFYEVQRRLGSACCDGLSADVTDHRFALGTAPPYWEAMCETPFYSATPLSITCILLI